MLGAQSIRSATASWLVSRGTFVSIVGVDAIPLSYYEHKLAGERVVEASPVPATIVRITQFHEFVFELCEAIARLPIWPVPSGIRIQPIAASEAAEALVKHAIPKSAGRVEPIGGPAVRTAGDLARSYRVAAGLRRPVVGLPVPGSVVARFRSGAATRPDCAVGTITWEAWLQERVA